jgi:hypothetical protein
MVLKLLFQSMFNIVKTILTEIFWTLSNKKSNWSARKLSAFAGVVITGCLTISNAKSDNAIEFAHAWLLFALLCLGAVTAEQLISLNINKNGRTKDNSEEVS